MKEHVLEARDLLVSELRAGAEPDPAGESQ
jgi:hypothetical protein